MLMADIVDWQQPPRRFLPRRLFLLVLAILAIVIFSSRTALSYYVDALWFGSLGYGDVFRKTLTLQWVVFAAFFAVTFLFLYGWFLALRRAYQSDLPDDYRIVIGGQPLKLPVAGILHLLGLVVSLLIAVVTGASMMTEWPTFALYWYATRATGGAVDPIFGKPINFYLFTLPAWQFVTGWLLTLSVIACVIAVFFIFVTGSTTILSGLRSRYTSRPWRGFSIAFGFLLLILAMRAYIARFERLFDEHTIFGGVTYTDAHVMLPGMLAVCAALVLGAAIATINVVAVPRARWLVAAVAPAAVCYLALQIVGWYVSSFIVKPNELVRERPYIAYNIDLTRQAYGLDRLAQREFPAETTVEAADPANNRATLQNIRLWDWRALQDTLRQIQEIRTYYDFPDIDIDRYEVGRSVRQMMLAVRELNVDKLPQSSRNWINEKLIYTHGYGVTMNPVNGFTPEGLPTLVLSNMPIQSTIPGLIVTRPEIYFGELTNTDVYVKTRQKEFNYPQGDANNLTSYQGNGGIRLGGWLRRTLIALDRGDLSKLPFSDDVNSESRLLMRRRLSERVQELAPFLTLDPDPYVVVGEDGRLYWLMDAFTTSDSYPYARRYTLGNDRINYIRNSVKILIDAYTGETTFYVFDTHDPVIAAYRAVFPGLFTDAAAMPAAVRKHVRYPELLLNVQAAVYGLYHMTNPDVFYNREDLWSVATEVALPDQRQQVMEPNFVLMTLPGERSPEFIAILPFTPANRNNLIGWIAGRSDGDLYAEPIYLQADRSPMPELRLVVLAVQDRLAYGPTFESAMAALFGTAPSVLSAQGSPVAPAAPPASAASMAVAVPGDVNALIAEAARDFTDYQRLTAAGKLAEAGEKLEELKRTLEELQTRRH